MIDDIFKLFDDNSSDENNNESLLDCPISKILLPLLLASSKPFGMLWPDDTMKDFLKQIGYRLVPITTEEGFQIDVAVKDNDNSIPTVPNIKDVFEKEVQDIILKELIKIKIKNQI